MLMPRRLRAPSANRIGGFSLIELMVSILIGMIVVAGAVSLIVAIDRSNSETIQATRINQELRALASVIADEIKRARHLHDPIAAVGQGAAANGSFDFIDTSHYNASHSTVAPKWSDCIIYGYEDTTLDSGATNQAVQYNYQMIYRKVTSGVGSVIFARDATTTTATNPLTCGSSTNTTTEVTLNSSQLDITDLRFSCVTSAGGTVSDDTTLSASCNEIDISLSAKLKAGDIYTRTITHQYVQQVFVRSGAVKTT